MTPLLDVVRQKLHTIYDKTVNQSIMDLGLIEGCHVDAQGHVKLVLKVTPGEEEAFAGLRQHLQEVIGVLPGVQQVSVFFSTPSTPCPSTVWTPKFPAARHMILVGAGKGGVGKSTVAVNLSCALAQAGHRVGLMDADIYGPSVPLMMGEGDVTAQPEVTPTGAIVPLRAHGISYLSIAHFLRSQGALVWRGPMLQKSLMQMLTQTDWGLLDYLIIDLPPGTGDVPLTLAQKLPLAGAILVTTPQVVAQMDVRRAADLCAHTQIPLLGIVENMSAFACPHCDHVTDIFAQKGGEILAKELQVPLLAQIPIDCAIREGGDRGQPVVIQNHPVAVVYQRMASALATQLDSKTSY